MTRSMTAFATHQGQSDGASWIWDLRCVNGRGLDMKTRLPEGIEGLEAELRAAVASQATRGNFSISLRLSRDQAEGDLVLDPTRLDAVLAALDAVQERAFDKGVTLGQPTAADVLATRGVLVAGAAGDLPDLKPRLLADFTTALRALMDMRAAEGAALQPVLLAQLDRVETLCAEAVAAASARTQARKGQITAALARIMEDISSVDPDRIAQELALIAIKSDITEELDRLTAHIAAARDLVAQGGPIGRKFDFLTQEFNREANTLCAKAQDAELTRIGLALKAVIDQMREQIQNLE